MHRDHAAFILALDAREKVRVAFFSKEDGHALVRTCAPMDYGPRIRAPDQADCYHLWDYDSDRGPHALGLLPGQVTSIQPTGEYFDPGEFITWSPVKWFHPRD